MMSAATAPAKRSAENVTVTNQGSQVQLIHMSGELDLATADGLTEQGYAATGRGPRVLLLAGSRPACWRPPAGRGGRRIMPGVSSPIRPPGKCTTWREVPGGRERDSDDATGGRGGRPG